MEKNQIWCIACFLEDRKDAFAVSRLIMLSGVRVREFAASTAEDPAALRKVEAALAALLTAEEAADLDHYTPKL